MPSALRALRSLTRRLPPDRDYAALILEKRKVKSITAEQAAQLAVDPIYHATCRLAAGAVDALVTGAVHATGDMLRPALQIVGTAPGNKTVSSMFLMVMPDGRLFEFGDSAVVPDPTTEQLADIAIATASTFRKLTDIEPAVAILSFSIKGSASHEMVDKVVQATKLARAKKRILQLTGNCSLTRPSSHRLRARSLHGASSQARQTASSSPSSMLETSGTSLSSGLLEPTPSVLLPKDCPNRQMISPEAAAPKTSSTSVPSQY